MAQKKEKVAQKPNKKWTTTKWTLLFMASLGVVFLLVFNYAPMYGIILAFKKGDYVIDIKRAIFDSEWVGLKNFDKFLTDPQFKNVIVNTLCLNLLSLLINFPAPIQANNATSILRRLLPLRPGKRSVGGYGQFAAEIDQGGVGDMPIWESGKHRTRDLRRKLLELLARGIFRLFRVEIADDNGSGLIEHSFGNHFAKHLISAWRIFVRVLDEDHATRRIGQPTSLRRPVKPVEKSAHGKTFNSLFRALDNMQLQRLR